MDINQCPNCQNQYDQDRRVSKQLPCGCVSCLQCYKSVFQLSRGIACIQHQQVYNINPEELQDYVIQQQVQQQLQYQNNFMEQINDQFRCLQDQYVKKQNHNHEIIKVIQNCSLFMKYIQQLAIKQILKTLIDQFSMSQDKINNLLKRLSGLQVANKIYQQQQALILGQQDPNIRQNVQDQQQQQFQQILFEIEELKNQSQWMDVQSLRVNVQRCMFGLFVYLRDNSGGQLLSNTKAEFLIQKYFKQFKIIRGLSQVSNSLVQQKSSLQSQIKQQQQSQESQRIDNYQQQNQLFDKQQGLDLVQSKQFLIQNEISLQERQVIDARVSFQQMEQKLLNFKNDFSFNNQVHQLCEEQSILNYVIQDFVGITIDNLLQFLSQIKNEKVSIQVLQFSPLNKLGLIEYPQVLLQLLQVTDQQICLKLSQMIQLSKNQPQLQLAAANAMTILNYMNYEFTNQDFSNLDLSNADLSDTTFASCNFVNSNFSQANLRNTKFIDCDLSNANLTSIITEYPHIFTGHTEHIRSVAISSDSEFIVSGSADETIRLWNTRTGTSQTMSGHTSTVNSVAISSDSQFIVSGS